MGLAEEALGDGRTDSFASAGDDEDFRRHDTIAAQPNSPNISVIEDPVPNVLIARLAQSCSNSFQKFLKI